MTMATFLYIYLEENAGVTYLALASSETTYVDISLRTQTYFLCHWFRRK